MSRVVGRRHGGRGHERYRVGIGGGYRGRGIGRGICLWSLVRIAATGTAAYRSLVILSRRDTHMVRKGGSFVPGEVTNGGGLTLTVLGRTGVSIIAWSAVTVTGRPWERMLGVVGVVAMMGRRLEVRLRSKVRPSPWKSPS